MTTFRKSSGAFVPRRTAAVGAAVLLLTAAAACGGSGSKNAANTAANTSSALAGSSRPAPSTPANSSPAVVITQDQLDAAMLSVSDIGPGFKAGTYQRTAGAGPCEPTGTPSVDQRVPPQVESGREFDSTKVTAELVQEAAVYSTTAEAARAFTLAVHGTSCRNGVLSDGTRVTIAPGQDVTAQVNGDTVGKSTAWQLSSGTIRGVIVATLSGRVANACIFVAAANVDTSELPNPVAVAKIAFDKLLAH